jgi:hypothetical protein
MCFFIACRLLILVVTILFIITMPKIIIIDVCKYKAFVSQQTHDTYSNCFFLKILLFKSFFFTIYVYFNFNFNSIQARNFLY